MSSDESESVFNDEPGVPTSSKSRPKGTAKGKRLANSSISDDLTEIGQSVENMPENIRKLFDRGSKRSIAQEKELKIWLTNEKRNSHKGVKRASLPKQEADIERGMNAMRMKLKRENPEYKEQEKTQDRLSKSLTRLSLSNFEKNSLNRDRRYNYFLEKATDEQKIKGFEYHILECRKRKYFRRVPLHIFLDPTLEKQSLYHCDYHALRENHLGVNILDTISPKYLSHEIVFEHFTPYRFYHQMDIGQEVFEDGYFTLIGSGCGPKGIMKANSTAKCCFIYGDISAIEAKLQEWDVGVGDVILFLGADVEGGLIRVCVNEFWVIKSWNLAYDLFAFESGEVSFKKCLDAFNKQDYKIDGNTFRFKDQFTYFKIQDYDTLSPKLYTIYRFFRYKLSALDVGKRKMMSTNPFYKALMVLAHKIHKFDYIAAKTLTRLRLKRTYVDNICTPFYIENKWYSDLIKAANEEEPEKIKCFDKGVTNEWIVEENPGPIAKNLMMTFRKKLFADFKVKVSEILTNIFENKPEFKYPLTKYKIDDVLNAIFCIHNQTTFLRNISQHFSEPYGGCPENSDKPKLTYPWPNTRVIFSGDNIDFKRFRMVDDKCENHENKHRIILDLIHDYYSYFDAEEQKGNEEIFDSDRDGGLESVSDGYSSESTTATIRDCVYVFLENEGESDVSDDYYDYTTDKFHTYPLTTFEDEGVKIVENCFYRIPAKDIIKPIHSDTYESLHELSDFDE